MLSRVLLQIRGALEKKSDNGEHKARDAERVGSLVSGKPEQYRRSFQYIKDCGGNPDTDLCREGYAVILFDFAFHPAMVRGFEIAVCKISGKPAAVRDEQHTLQNSPRGKISRKQHQKPGPDQCDGSSVSDRYEPNIFVETAGTGDQRQNQKNQKILHIKSPFRRSSPAAQNLKIFLTSVTTSLHI